MTGVPARGTESCTQVDEDVAGKPLLPEGLRLRQDLLATCQGPVRLLVAQRPKRWHVGVSGEVRISGHDLRRIPTHNDKNIERQRRLRVSRPKASGFAAKIKASERQMEEQSPARSPYQPGDEDAGADDVELGQTLSILQRVQPSPAVKLLATFTQSECWCPSEEESQFT